MRKGVLVAGLLLLVACGSAAPTARQTPATTPVAISSSSPTSSPVASPSPFVAPTPVAPEPSTPKPVAFSCSSTIPAGAQLAIVTLRGSTDVVVRDITNLAKPVSRCAFKHCEQFCESYGPDNLRFVTARHISYIVRSVDGDGAMYLADLSSRKTLLVRKWGPHESYFWVYAWSPDGNSLTYLTSTEWRIRSAVGDAALSPSGSGLGYYGYDPSTDGFMVGFSPDGQYVAIDQSTLVAANTKGAVFKVLRVSDRKLVYSRTDGSMATWAGGTGAHLFFRIGSGLQEWDPIAGAQQVVPGLAWINPVPSADGQRIAYLTIDAKGNHFAGQVRLTDQPLRSISLSRLPRQGVAFLDPTLVWYAEESLCSASVNCAYGETSSGPPLTGRTYVHDLVTGIISSSVETAVGDVWPHLGSQ